jgi:cellulose synthase/poly-beta-1,6-N-acetylglucosamine synthase-like glycosyltransferase
LAEDHRGVRLVSDLPFIQVPRLMILHSVIVTYDRLYATQLALASYLETVTVPYTLIVVDNGSTDGTVEWLEELWLTGGVIDDYIELGENKYPGYACNRGWEDAPDDAQVFHRADNDWAYYPGWCDHLAEAFADPKVGQVGLRTDAEESHNGVPIPWNVGGNCVIRRELWDAGLRYDERPWTELPPGHS